MNELVVKLELKTKIRTESFFNRGQSPNPCASHTVESLIDSNPGVPRTPRHSRGSANRARGNVHLPGAMLGFRKQESSAERFLRTQHVTFWALKTSHNMRRRVFWKKFTLAASEGLLSIGRPNTQRSSNSELHSGPK